MPRNRTSIAKEKFTIIKLSCTVLQKMTKYGNKKSSRWLELHMHRINNVAPDASGS